MSSICSRIMFKQKQSELNMKKLKKNQNHALTIISDHFLFQFLTLSLFQVFWRFPEVRIHLKSCFLMLWTSLNLLRMILDEIGKLHFFIKNLIFFEIFGPVVNDGFDEIYPSEFSKSWIYHSFHRVRSIWRSLWFFYRVDFSKNWDMYPKFQDFWDLFFAGAWASIRQNSASEVIALEPICSKSHVLTK